jgi:hypothetical protein
LWQVVEVVVVVTPEVEVRVDLEKAQLQTCPGRTQLLLELVVLAHHNFLVIPPKQDLKKVETLLLLETIFQLPQLVEELVQEEVNQCQKVIVMGVLVVEVIGILSPQEQELMGKVLLADKGWAVLETLILAVVVVELAGLAERQLLESVETVAPVRALQFLAFQ